MTIFESLKWLTAAASIFGVVLNIRKRHECFYVWAITNAAWTVIDVMHGVWSQAFLQAVYFCLAVWGIRSWRKSRA